MSELLVPPSEFNDLASDYRQTLSLFREHAQISNELFYEPDYAMVKAKDSNDFAEKVRNIRPWTTEDEVAFLELDWRFIAIAELAIPYTLAESKYYNLVEIMEPKHFDYRGMEYVSFYHPDLNRVETLLKKRNIRVERFNDRDLDWRWISTPINDLGQEVRFSDTRLLEVLEQETENGKLRII